MLTTSYPFTYLTSLHDTQQKLRNTVFQIPDPKYFLRGTSM